VLSVIEAVKMSRWHQFNVTDQAGIGEVIAPGKMLEISTTQFSWQAAPGHPGLTGKGITRCGAAFLG
jgi:hypothetical protein